MLVSRMACAFVFELIGLGENGPRNALQQGPGGLQHAKREFSQWFESGTR